MKNLIIILVLIYSIFLFPFLRSGIPLSHDGESHIARVGAYYNAFKEGQFLPRWAGSLNFRFGTPVFIFIYPLPYYMASLFHASGINLEDTFKLLLSISFIMSGIGFFLWVSRLVHKEAAFLGALLFGLAPYHFLNIYVRGDLGEMVALAILPFIFWHIEKISSNNNILDILSAGILYGLLIVSHNGISLMFSPVFLLYCFIRSKKIAHLRSFFTFFIIGIFLSTYFWVPAIVEAQYIGGGSAIGNMYKQHFPSFLSLIYSSWGFGPDVNGKNGLSPQVGVILFFFVLADIVHVFKYKKKLLGFWLAVFFAAIFLSISLSNIVWDKITFLRLFEFPWRFTALSSFAAAIIGAYVIDRIKNKKVIYCTTIVIVITCFFYTNTGVQSKKDDMYYYSFTGSTTYRRAITTIWTGGDPFLVPKKNLEIISGDGQINNLIRKSNFHSFTLTAYSDIRILDNTFYFPGWKVEVDGKKTNIEFQDINHRGLIIFRVPKGVHIIHVIFAESRVRLAADLVSVLAAIFVLGIWMKRIRIPGFL